MAFSINDLLVCFLEALDVHLKFSAGSIALPSISFWSLCPPGLKCLAVIKASKICYKFSWKWMAG